MPEMSNVTRTNEPKFHHSLIDMFACSYIWVINGGNQENVTQQHTATNEEDVATALPTFHHNVLETSAYTYVGEADGKHKENSKLREEHTATHCNTREGPGDVAAEIPSYVYAYKYIRGIVENSFIL